jgi:hypothetical protein
LGILSLVALVSSLVLAYLARGNDYLLNTALLIAGYSLGNVMNALSRLPKGLQGPVFLCGTVFRNAQIRVSIAYLISIPVDDCYLLVRGHRITTQFQPVGGVYKTHLTAAELSRRFNASPDTRFMPDLKSSQDLRLRLPGRSVASLIKWFDSETERELFPWREFYEELVASGHLSANVFPYFDCTRLGRSRLPFRIDRFSGLRQIIFAERYELRPTDAQLQALRDLRARHAVNPTDGLYFATDSEIRHGGPLTGSQIKFNIAPTASWLIKGE